MKTYKSQYFYKILFAIIGIGLIVSSFIFKHYRLHFIEKESDFISIENKEIDTSESYHAFSLMGFTKISKDEPRYYLYLTRLKQRYSVKYGEKHLNRETILKRKAEVSKSEFENYRIGDVLNYSENQRLWNLGSTLEEQTLWQKH